MTVVWSSYGSGGTLGTLPDQTNTRWSDDNCVIIKSLIRWQLCDQMTTTYMTIWWQFKICLISNGSFGGQKSVSGKGCDDLIADHDDFDALTIWRFDNLTIWRSDNLTIWRGAKMQISKCRTEHLKHAPLIKAAMKNPKIIGRKYLLVMMMLLVIFIDGHCWQKKLLTVGIICQATKKWNTQISKVLHKAQASTTGPTKNLNFTSAIRVFFFCPVLFCFVLILHIPGTFAVDFQLFHCKQFEEFNYQSIADFMQSKWAAV